MDGILFIAAWACILPLFLALVSGWADDTIFSYVVEGRTRSYKVWNACDSLFTYSPLAWTSAFFERLVVAKQPLNDGMCVNFALAAAVGVAEMAAAYTLLFVCADRDKSENADQISSSWWGYKVLIPAYLALAVAVLRPDLLFGGVDWWMVLIWVVLLVLALVLYFAYRRSFRLKKRDGHRAPRRPLRAECSSRCSRKLPPKRRRASCPSLRCFPYSDHPLPIAPPRLCRGGAHFLWTIQRKTAKIR